MSPPNFAARLKSARQLRGLSLRQLCDRLDNKISRQSISQYENGAMHPSRENLLLICEVLELSPEYFNRESIELSEVEFRKLNKLPVKEQQRIEAAAADFLSRFLELETLLGAEILFEKPKLKKGISTYGEVEEAAQKVRELWKLGEDPLSNVVELLEEKGIKVCEIEADDAFSGMAAKSAEGHYVIVLNKSPEIEIVRKRFTALHELAHIILVFASDIEEKQKEKFCHYFAGAMLFPKSKVEQELGGFRKNIHLQELLAIKSQYGISMQAILYRLRQLGIISEYHYRTQMKMIIQRGWKKKEPQDFIGREHSNRMIQLLCRGIAEEIISTSKAANLYGTTLANFRRILNQPLKN